MANFHISQLHYCLKMSSEALQELTENESSQEVISESQKNCIKQVEEMVEQMRSVPSFDWEDDVNDPFEKAIAKSGASHERPRSAEETDRNNRGYNRGRGRFQRSRGNFNRRGSLQNHRSQLESDSSSEIDFREFPKQQSLRNQGRNFRKNTGRHLNRRANQRNHGYNSYDSDNYSTSGAFSDQNEESYSPRGSHMAKSERISPWSLVDCLAECPDFRASLLQLLEWKNMSPSAVREVVVANGQIFSLNGETVELCPKVSICSAHSGPHGCLNRSLCSDLHMCPTYVTSWCSDKNCALGHKWFTEHNKAIFRKFYLERLRYQSIGSLMKSLVKPDKPIGQLDICQYYNGNGCNNMNCNALHVCHSFLSGLTKCTLPGCKLNHDLLNPECSKLLRVYGFSTNEAPRDVAVALLAAYPSLANANPTKRSSTISTPPKVPPIQANTSAITTKQQQDVRAIGNSKSNDTGIFSLLKQKITGSSSDKQDSAESVTNINMNDSKNHKKREISDGDQKSPVKRKDKADRPVRNSKGDNTDTAQDKHSAVKKPEKYQTVWSHYLYGDTEINEICYYSVENSCKYERAGCKRLHAARHFHWQISEQGSKWLNLRSFQVDCLEHAFCNPANDGVTIPRLDPAKLNPSVNQLLIVLGRDTWQANFQSLIIANSDQSRILYLRRLCTEFIAGQQVKPSIYCWYFIDIKKNWVKYGKVDTANETNLVSSVTSADIEKSFLKSQHVPLTFKNAKYTYVLDYITMTQTNQNTKVRRDVRRRPEPHLKDENQVNSKTTSDNKTSEHLPSTWDPMQPEERVRLVALSPTSPEYQTVVGLLKGGIANTNITKIERVQNPFLWKALQNKIKEMTTVYGDIKKVDVRQLFHGTRPDVIASICAENFDWRLHGSSSGQAHGRGTYFSPNAGTSYGYCRADSAGLKYMFIARVAVGSITPGNSSMARPPINPATGAPFDSTGDGVSVVVKYDKQEYYPEFVLTMR